MLSFGLFKDLFQQVFKVLNILLPSGQHKWIYISLYCKLRPLYLPTLKAVLFNATVKPMREQDGTLNEGQVT